MSRQQANDLFHRRRAQQLIRHDDASDADPCAERKLMHVRNGDAPRAGVELLREDLRRHRRFAVRREQYAARLRKVAHPRVVMRGARCHG
jgi:hypothetical protein